MTYIQEKRAEKKLLVSQARVIVDRAEAENRDMTPEEEGEFNRLHEEARAIQDDLDLTFNNPVMKPEIPGEEYPEGYRFENKGIVIGEDDRGREIRAFEPGEKLSDGLRFNLPDGIRPGELDMGRFVRALVTGDWSKAQAEFRVCQYSKRAMSVGDPASAGWLAPEPISANIIDLARNQTRVFQAGAQTIAMDSTNLNLVKITGGHAPSWVPENAEFTESSIDLGVVTLRAKKQGALVKVSLEAIEDAPNLADLISNAIAADMAVSLDFGALYGSGAESEPLGLKNTDDIESVDLSNAAITDFSKFSEAYFKLLANNAPEDGVAMIMSPTLGGYIDDLKEVTEAQPLLPPPSWAKIRKLMTNQVSSATGTGSANTEAFMGHFANMLIGVRKDIDIEISRVAGDSFTNGQVWIRAYWRGDVAITRPNWFCHIGDIAAPGE